MRMRVVCLIAIISALGLGPESRQWNWDGDILLSTIPGMTNASLDIILDRIGRFLHVPDFASQVDRQQLHTFGELTKAAAIARASRLLASVSHN